MLEHPHFTLSINIGFDGGASCLNCTSQSINNRFMQPIQLIISKRIGWMLRVNLRFKQRFIHINIPQPDNIFLIEQSWFYLCGTLGYHLTKNLDSKGILKRFKPQFYQRLILKLIPCPK
ncbi:hypothetical protein D1872_293660 [compost metagenome]